MQGTYAAIKSARRIARLRANQEGRAWAIVARDGLSAIRWEIMPAAKVRPDESAEVLPPTHRHRPDGTRTEPFSGPVRPERPNVAAHGGYTCVALCRCGAERRSNHNQGNAEYGPWMMSEDDT